VVEASINVGNNLVRFRGLIDFNEWFTKAFEELILPYDGAGDKNQSALNM